MVDLLAICSLLPSCTIASLSQHILFNTSLECSIFAVAPQHRFEELSTLPKQRRQTKQRRCVYCHAGAGQSCNPLRAKTRKESVSFQLWLHV
jgi:hypothetical protein